MQAVDHKHNYKLEWPNRQLLARNEKETKLNGLHFHSPEILAQMVMQTATAP